MAISSLQFVAKSFSQEETGKLLRAAGFQTDESLTRILFVRVRHGDKWERIFRNIDILPLSQSSHQSTYFEPWNIETTGEYGFKIRAPRSLWARIERLNQFLRIEQVLDISQPAMARGNDFAPMEMKEIKARQRAKIEKRYRFAPLPTDGIRETGKEDEVVVALRWYMENKDTFLGKNGLPIGAMIDAMETAGKSNDELVEMIVALWEKKGKPDSAAEFRNQKWETAPPVSHRAPRIKRKRKIRIPQYDVKAHWGSMFPIVVG